SERTARKDSSTVSSPSPAVRAAAAERATSAGGGDEGVFDISSRYGQGLTRTPHRRPFPPPPRLRLHNDPKRGRRRGARESGAQATVKSTFASPGSVAPPSTIVMSRARVSSAMNSLFASAAATLSEG